jgi:hypothetical protein
MGLDLVEMVMNIEDDFGIEVPDDLASACITVGDTQKMIADLLVAQGRIRSPELEAEVWDGLVKMTIEQFGVKRESIQADMRWIPDFTQYG